jgi:hypothetical protein
MLPVDTVDVGFEGADMEVLLHVHGKPMLQGQGRSPGESWGIELG